MIGNSFVVLNLDDILELKKAQERYVTSQLQQQHDSQLR